MSTNSSTPLSIQEIKNQFLRRELGATIHKELVVKLTEKEHAFIKDETQLLVTKNMEYGGSPLGFFYKGQLFAVAPTFKKENITMLHSSLENEAEMLLLNRTDVPQYTTYIAHFLSYMTNHVEDPTAYVANLPRGLSKFSDSLKVFESFVENNDPEGMKTQLFSKDDPTKETYFLHYNRVDGPLNRFLFRRIAL